MQIIQMILTSPMLGNILLLALTIDRVLERIFPNAKVLKTIDQDLSAAGVKDIDGQ